MNEKGKTFQKEKKGKERRGEETFQKEKQKGKEWKHFGRRNGKERSGNILQRRRKERKIRKEEKACGGSRSDVAGYWELSFCYFSGPGYQVIFCGICFGVLVYGGG